LKTLFKDNLNKEANSIKKPAAGFSAAGASSHPCPTPPTCGITHRLEEEGSFPVDDKRNQNDILADLNLENPLTGIPIGVGVLQHIRQITGFDGGHHGLTTKAAIGQEPGIYLVAPQEWPHPPTSAKLCAEWLQLMTLAPDLSPDDWRRICDALRYIGRDLHHRSFSVSSERRELLWEEMDRCLNLADRLAQAIPAND
jgi:hypothetical protein